ncbi:hypothetical protein GGS23DRAFT_571388 [Durotheca rogersii]|uniref:uncharacterized protein n=1 Tax=Durotheca rogersii TaxID=419775 RepID=UPI002220697E|nr:uncharacterized protein GGS23DRAFT_571388 [Durotheca rogersii]KAI5862696.1 hypothetical protein GGS23DRAFT_571388 [Durotheca rogersii]
MFLVLVSSSVSRSQSPAYFPRLFSFFFSSFYSAREAGQRPMSPNDPFPRARIGVFTPFTLLSAPVVSAVLPLFFFSFFFFLAFLPFPPSTYRGVQRRNALSGRLELPASPSSSPLGFCPLSDRTPTASLASSCGVYSAPRWESEGRDTQREGEVGKGK